MLSWHEILHRLDEKGDLEHSCRSTLSLTYMKALKIKVMRLRMTSRHAYGVYDSENRIHQDACDKEASPLH